MITTSVTKGKFAVIFKGLGGFFFALVILFFVSPMSSQAVAPTCSTSAPCWVPMNPLPTARRDLGVAADANGHVFVAGGYNDGGLSSAFEEYNPATNTWSTKASVPVARNVMGFTYNPTNGKFYFGGGYNEGAHDEFYEYDPVSDSWTQKASLPEAAYNMRFAAANGMIYSIGGNGSLTNVQEYNPTTNQWNAKSEFPNPRSVLGLVTAPNGKIYAIGGEGSLGDVDYVDEYDPVADTWAVKESLPKKLSDMGISLTANGKILVAGGHSPIPTEPYSRSVYEYDPATDAWATRTDLPFGIYAPGLALGSDDTVHILGGLVPGDGLAAARTHYAYTTTTPADNCGSETDCWSLSPFMPTPRRDAGVAADADGKIYVAGGFSIVHNSDQSQNFTNVFEKFDPATGVWSEKAPVPVNRTDMGFAFNSTNGKFYYGGGWNEGGHNEFYEYDPGANTWTQKTSLPAALYGLRLAAANGKIYSAGGNATNITEYNPSSNSWTTKSAIPHPNSDLSWIKAPNGKIYAIGGADSSGSVNYVDEYNPATDMWTAKASMSSARHGMAASLTSQGTIIVVAGNTNDRSNIVEEYNPSTNTWITRNVFPFQAYAINAALGSDGKVYAIGGTINAPQSNTTYAWGDPTTSTPTPTPTPTQLSELSPAKVWVGLKNSDDVGIKFDLLVEAYKNGVLVSSGQLNSVTGGSSGFNNAKLNTIAFNSFTPVDFPDGSVLSLKVSVRNACVGSGKNSGNARLWFNDGAANSHFDATIEEANSDYFLRDGFLLSSTAGPGPKKTIDVASGAKCSSFKSFGTWTVTP